MDRASIWFSSIATIYYLVVLVESYDTDDYDGFRCAVVEYSSIVSVVRLPAVLPWRSGVHVYFIVHRVCLLLTLVQYNGNHRMCCTLVLNTVLWAWSTVPQEVCYNICETRRSKSRVICYEPIREAGMSPFVGEFTGEAGISLMDVCILWKMLGGSPSFSEVFHG